LNFPVFDRWRTFRPLNRSSRSARSGRVRCRIRGALCFGFCLRAGQATIVFRRWRPTFKEFHELTFRLIDLPAVKEFLRGGVLRGDDWFAHELVLECEGVRVRVTASPRFAWRDRRDVTRLKLHAEPVEVLPCWARRVTSSEPRHREALKVPA
jgi:hypothetical protein